jgi:hypothetical protein
VTTAIGHNQIQNPGALENFDSLAVAHATDKGSRDLGAGLIAMRVDDPTA